MTLAELTHKFFNISVNSAKKSTENCLAELVWPSLLAIEWNHTWNEIKQHMIRHTTQRVIRWITELTILFLNTINFETDPNRDSNPDVSKS